jgi:hypothetical protein
VAALLFTTLFLDSKTSANPLLTPGAGHQSCNW